jgi:hypothetical protein
MRAVIWRIVYWIAVIAISLALVVGLILFLESRDQSTLDEDSRTAPVSGLRA